MKGTFSMNSRKSEIHVQPSDRISAATTVLKALSLVAIIGLFGCHKEEEKKAAAPPAPRVDGGKIIIPSGAPQNNYISVQEANARKATISHLSGRLVWNDETTVRIFSPVAGRVESVVAHLGQTVSSGDTLAKMASPDFGQAQADLRKASGDLQLAERALSRVRDLNNHGAAPTKDVESAEADHTRALSEKDRCQARMTLYGGTDKAIDQMYPLVSPLPGVVVEKNINPGQEVRPDQMLANAPQLFAPLFVVSDPGKLWVVLDVTELDVACLKPGAPLRITSRAFPDKTFDGRIIGIGNSLDPTTRTVKVQAEVENPDKLLRAEMYVTVDAVSAVEVAENQDSGADISSKAVFLKDNQHYVFVEAAPGQYERKVVQVGSESDGKVLIIQGIHVGEKVVTEGCLLLQSLIESSDTKS